MPLKKIRSHVNFITRAEDYTTIPPIIKVCSASDKQWDSGPICHKQLVKLNLSFDHWSYIERWGTALKLLKILDRIPCMGPKVPREIPSCKLNFCCWRLWAYIYGLNWTHTELLHQRRYMYTWAPRLRQLTGLALLGIWFLSSTYIGVSWQISLIASRGLA